MAEKGLSKYWTPHQEAIFRKLLDSCHTFATRQLLMGIINLVKHDGRTKAEERARAKV